MNIKMFTADANYPSRMHVNSYAIFLEVQRGTEFRTYRVEGQRSQHKVTLKILEKLSELELTEVMTQIKTEEK